MTITRTPDGAIVITNGTRNNRRRRRRGPRATIATSLAMVPYRPPGYRNMRRDIRDLRTVNPAIRPIVTNPPVFNMRRLNRALNSRRRRARFSPTKFTFNTLIKQISSVKITPGLNTFRFRPGHSSWTQLDALGKLFDLYCLPQGQHHVRFTPSVPTTVQGSVTIGIDYQNNKNVVSEDDVVNLHHSTRKNIFVENRMAIEPRLAMKSRWHSTSYSNSTDKTLPETAYTIYLYVNVQNQEDLTDIGKLELCANVTFDGFSVREDPNESEVPVVQTEVANLPGMPLINSDPAANISGQGAEESDLSNFEIEEALAYDTTAGGQPEPFVELALPAMDAGEHLSIVSTDSLQDAQGIVQHLGSALPPTAYFAKPRVHFRSKSTGESLDHLFQSTDSDAQITGSPGFRHGRLLRYGDPAYKVPVTALSNDIDALADGFSDIFKTVGDIAKSIEPVANIFTSFLGSGGLVANPPRHPVPGLEYKTGVSPHQKQINASDKYTQSPSIQAAAIGDEVNALVDNPPSLNAWDHSIFGVATRMNSDLTFPAHTDQWPYVVLDHDYEIDYSYGGGWIGISPVDASPFGLNETISAVVQVMTVSATPVNAHSWIAGFADEMTSGMTLRAASYDLNTQVATAASNPAIRSNLAANLWSVNQNGVNGQKIWFNLSSLTTLLTAQTADVYFSLVLARTVPTTRKVVDVPVDSHSSRTNISLGARRTRL